MQKYGNVVLPVTFTECLKRTGMWYLKLCEVLSILPGAQHSQILFFFFFFVMEVVSSDSEMQIETTPSIQKISVLPLQ